MIIIGSVVLGSIIFFGIVLLTLIFGALGRESEKDVLLRTKLERREGLTGDVTSDTPDPVHERYLQT